MNIHQRILAAKLEFDPILKETTNPFLKSKYADLSTILSAIEPSLTKHKLLLTQPINEGRVYSTITDTETGEFIHSAIELPEASDPQKMGAAITYFRRFTLQSLLALRAEDDDGHSFKQHAPVIKPVETRHTVTSTFEPPSYLDDAPPIAAKLQPSREPEQTFFNTPSSYAKFVIGFGKYRDKKLEDLTLDTHKGYISWLESTGKAPTGAVLDYITTARQYIKAIQSRVDTFDIPA